MSDSDVRDIISRTLATCGLARSRQEADDAADDIADNLRAAGYTLAPKALLRRPDTIGLRSQRSDNATMMGLSTIDPISGQPLTNEQWKDRYLGYAKDAERWRYRLHRHWCRLRGRPVPATAAKLRYLAYAIPADMAAARATAALQRLEDA